MWPPRRSSPSFPVADRSCHTEEREAPCTADWFCSRSQPWRWERFRSSSLAEGKQPKCLIVNLGGGGGTWDTLQAAQDAAAAGDTLKVKGTCHGPTTLSKDLTVVGQSNPGFGTATLDGDRAGSVVTIGPGVSAAISDLTITGGARRARRRHRQRQRRTHRRRVGDADRLDRHRQHRHQPRRRHRQRKYRHLPDDRRLDDQRQHLQPLQRHPGRRRRHQHLASARRRSPARPSAATPPSAGAAASSATRVVR